MSEPPTIEILEPTPGEPYSESSPVRFLAEVSDPDNEPTQLTVAWDSNIQGELTIRSPDPDGVIDSMVELVGRGRGESTLNASRRTSAGGTLNEGGQERLFSK